MKKILLSLIIGLSLFFNSCEPDSKYTIGQSYGGGIIFYIDETGEHGIVCASIDQGTTILWGIGGQITTNATGTEIGKGKTNTTAIVSTLGAGNYAASICDALELNGYSDWYLPSLQELLLMNTTLAMKGLGGFASDEYWSSTENNSWQAWNVFLGSATDYRTNDKINQFRVRAVRSF